MLYLIYAHKVVGAQRRERAPGQGGRGGRDTFTEQVSSAITIK